MAQNGMLDRDMLVKECGSAIDRYQEVWSTIKAKEKDIDSFTTDKTIESKSFDNLKAVMSDYILVIGAMGTAVNFDLNDCQMLKKTINNVDINKIDVGNLQNQVATAETTIETNKSRLENIQKNLNSCANDNSEAAAQRSTQLRNDIRNYGYNIKNYNEIVNICNHYIQEYQDIEKNTSNFFTQGKTYRDKANGLLDEIMGSFTNGQYSPKQVSSFRNELAEDEKVKATLSIAYESNIEKLGISKNRIQKLKEYGLSMRDIYFLYQNPKTSKKILYIIKGDKESLKKLFLEDPDIVDGNTKAFLVTYVNVLFHKDKKAFCELQNVKNTSIYALSPGEEYSAKKTPDGRTSPYMDEVARRDFALESYEQSIKDKSYKTAAKILEENNKAFGSYRSQWDNMILSGELAQAKMYSNQTVNCYNAAHDPKNKYKNEDMKNAQSMYASYQEIMETVSAVAAVKDLNSKNGMVILDKPVKDSKKYTERFEIRKYNLKDKLYEKEYKTTLNIQFKDTFEKADNGRDDLKNISDKQKEDQKKIREDKKQLFKTVELSALQIIPGAGALYDTLYSVDQIASTNYNCVSGQDKVPEYCQTGVHSILNAGTALAQANQLLSDCNKAEKDYKDNVDFAYSKWFGSFCCYDEGTDEAGKDVNKEYNYSYITDIGFDPCIRIEMEKWKKDGMESIVNFTYNDQAGGKEKFMNVLKEDKKMYRTFMNKKIDLQSSSEKYDFMDDMCNFGDFMDNHHSISCSHNIRNHFQDSVSSVKDELITED
ncbi:hypothetical protein [Lachnobacterium bovis]|uniref:Uncharacterized protein n=1 Tax=Lachnobacterium bovis TaxID=140626 RepID=A0A1H9UZV3_9FIRM|nr:hypothetical protein [Lachnobacterium bovis]SES14869.1 hypothetical protein SAMN02910429_02333 [Lachnobacterium bovis]